MKTSEISCYYCAHTTNSYQHIIDHLVSTHNDRPLKVKLYILCPVTGTIEFKTKTHPTTPEELSPNERIIYNSSINKVQIVRDTPKAYEESASPVMKKDLLQKKVQLLKGKLMKMKICITLHRYCLTFGMP